MLAYIHFMTLSEFSVSPQSYDRRLAKEMSVWNEKKEKENSPHSLLRQLADQVNSHFITM